MQVENCKMCMGPLLRDSAVFSLCVTLGVFSSPSDPLQAQSSPTEVGTGTIELSPQYKGLRGYKAVLKRSPAFLDLGITQNVLNHLVVWAIKIPLLQLLQFHLLDRQVLSIPVSYKNTKKLYLYMYTQRALLLLLLK